MSSGKIQLYFTLAIINKPYYINFLKKLIAATYKNPVKLNDPYQQHNQCNTN